MLELKKARLTETGIQAEVRGSCTFPPVPPPSAQTSASRGPGLFLRPLQPRVSLPQVLGQATETQQHPLVAQILCCQASLPTQPNQLLLPPYR